MQKRQYRQDQLDDRRAGDDYSSDRGEQYQLLPLGEGFLCRFGEGLLDLCRVALILCTAHLHEVAARDPDALGGAGSFVILNEKYEISPISPAAQG